MSKECLNMFIKTSNLVFTSVPVSTSCQVSLFNKCLNSLILFSPKHLFNTLFLLLVWDIFFTGSFWARWSGSPSSVTVAGYL